MGRPTVSEVCACVSNKLEILVEMADEDGVGGGV